MIIPFGHFLGAHLDVAFPEIANDLRPDSVCSWRLARDISLTLPHEKHRTGMIIFAVPLIQRPSNDLGRDFMFYCRESISIMQETLMRLCGLACRLPAANEDANAAPQFGSSLVKNSRPESL